MRDLPVLAGTWLLVAAACMAQETVPSSERPMYVNRVYGYRVVLPPGLSYKQTVPPNPDHGIGIDVSPATSLRVDASSTETISTQVEARSASSGCKVLQRQNRQLGGRPALALRLACPGTATEGRYEEERVLRVAYAPGRSPICFSVVVRTQGAHADPKGTELWKKLVAGFSFTE